MARRLRTVAQHICGYIRKSFSLEKSERVNVNMDTVDTYLVKFDREGVGD